MEQICKVISGEFDADETGSWQVYYVLYEGHDDDEVARTSYNLYTDDGKGNGHLISRGYNRGDMVSLTLRLGDFVEWKPKN